MVPLAMAIRGAGHEVGFATAERFCRRVVEPSGFLAFAAGMSPPVAFERTMELVGGVEPSEGDLLRFGARMFAEVAAPAKVGDLVRVIRAWGADLVVHDMTDFAGPVAAATCGIPWVCHSFGALQPEEFWEVAGEAVAPTWSAWGEEPGPFGGMFRSMYLDLCPRGLQSSMIDRVPVARALRPVTFDNPSGEAAPSWLDGLASAPTVYVTLGTVANHTPQVFEAVLAGVTDLTANVIVTVGSDRDPAELGPQPPNVRVMRYLPQSLVFPACDLVVCHGGSGTTLAALAAGLPLLMLPQEANQFWNADRVVTLAAGELLRPSQLTADAVHRAIGPLLADPAYRTNARLLAAAIAAMPGPDDLVPSLVELARGQG